MKRLLTIEYYKLRGHNAFWVLSGIYFLLLALGAYFVGVFEWEMNGISSSLGDFGIFDYPFIWQNVTWVAAQFKILLAMIVMTFIGNEYSYRTLKQNLIDGLSKKEFLQSKVYMIGAISLASTAFVALIIIILGGMYSSISEIDLVFSKIEFLGAYFLKIFAFFVFCMFITFLVRKTGFALIALVIWAILEPILGYKVKALSPYLPLNSMSNLIHEPFTRLTNIDKMIDMKSVTDVALTDVGIVAAWAAIFIFGSYQILKSRDL